MSGQGPWLGAAILAGAVILAASVVRLLLDGGRRVEVTGRLERDGFGPDAEGDQRARRARRFPVVSGLSGRMRPDPRRRRPHRIDQDVVEFAEALAVAVRHGRTLREAVDVSLPESLAAQWGASPDHPELRLLSLGVRISESVGGSTVGLFDAAARTVRQRMAGRSAARVATASARASAALLSLLPVGVVGLLSVDPGFRSNLFTTSAGLGALVVAAGLDAVGWVWMRRLMAGVG